MEEEAFSRENAVTMAQFKLQPDVPQEERENFVKFIMMFGKSSASSNIQREDVMNFMWMFDEIAMAYDDGYFDYAHELQANFLTKLQLCRSVGGFETMWSSGGMSKAEQISKFQERTAKRTFRDKLKGAFGKREPQEPVQHPGDGM